MKVYEILIFVVGIIITFIVAFGLGFMVCKNIMQSELVKTKKYLNNAWKYQYFLINLSKLKTRGISVSDFVRNNNYKKVAIYGLSFLAEVVYEDLRHDDIDVVCFIDRNKEGDYDGVRIVKPDESANADLIIVCVAFGMPQIRHSLEKANDCDMYYIYDVIVNLSEGETV